MSSNNLVSGRTSLYETKVIIASSAIHTVIGAMLTSNPCIVKSVCLSVQMSVPTNFRIWKWKENSRKLSRSGSVLRFFETRLYGCLCSCLYLATEYCRASSSRGICFIFDPDPSVATVGFRSHRARTQSNRVDLMALQCMMTKLEHENGA